MPVHKTHTERLSEEKTVSSSALDDAHKSANAKRRDVGAWNEVNDLEFKRERKQAELAQKFLVSGYKRVDITIKNGKDERTFRWTVVREYCDISRGIYSLASPIWANTKISSSKIGDIFEFETPRNVDEHELFESCIVDFGPDGVRALRNWRSKAESAENLGDTHEKYQDFELTSRFIFTPNKEQEDLYQRADEVVAGNLSKDSEITIASPVTIQLITGVAGSGKTSVALGHLNFLAQQSSEEGQLALTPSSYLPHRCLGIALTEALLPTLQKLARGLDLENLPLVSYERGIRSILLEKTYGPLRRQPAKKENLISPEDLALKTIRRFIIAAKERYETTLEKFRSKGATEWERALIKIQQWLGTSKYPNALVFADLGMVLISNLREEVKRANERDGKRERSKEAIPQLPTPDNSWGLKYHFFSELNDESGKKPIPEPWLDVLVLFAVRYRDNLGTRSEIAEEEYNRTTKNIRNRLAGFVDEVQDFSAIQLLIIESLFRSNAENVHPRLMLAGDFQQGIWRNGVVSPNDFPFAVEHLKHMTLNERQTSELNALSSSFRVTIQKNSHSIQSSTRHGERPVYWATSDSDDFSIPAELWEQMIGEGQWTIICATDEIAKLVAQKVEDLAKEWGRLVTIWLPTQAIDVEGKSHDFHIGTVLAFKGLEANKVVIAGVQHFDVKHRIGRDALYVAITRARENLHIIGPLISQLDDNLASIFKHHCRYVE